MLLTTVAGWEPEYTSSHSQFMDTCDYIWYTDTALCGTRHKAQQQLGPSDQTSVAPDLEAEGTINSSAAQPESKQGSQAAGHYGYALKPVAVLVPPDGMRLPRGLPSRWLGSDHVCLVADFELSAKHA